MTNAFVTILPGPKPSGWEARDEAVSRGMGPAQAQAFANGVFYACHKGGCGPTKRFATQYQAGVEWGEAEINRRAQRPLDGA